MLNYLKLCIYKFFLGAFFACAAKSPHDAFQEGINHLNYYETPHKDLLRYAHFKSPVKGPKNSVLFIQGRGTFLEFYEDLVVPLLERGLDVWIYDLSGQGGSTRLLLNEPYNAQIVQQMQHVDTFNFYLDDMDFFISEILLPNAEGFLILGGYSTGGHVALRYLQIHEDHPFKAGFMISPLLALRIPLSNTSLSYLFWGASWLIDLHGYVPGATHEDPIFAMSFEKNPYTSDQAGFQKLKQLCIENRTLVMGGISYGWLKAACESLTELWNPINLKKIHIPILVGTGGEDGVVDVNYNEQFVDKLIRGTHIYYQDGRHELFHETEEIQSDWWANFDQLLYIVD